MASRRLGVDAGKFRGCGPQARKRGLSGCMGMNGAGEMMGKGALMNRAAEDLSCGLRFATCMDESNTQQFACSYRAVLGLVQAVSRRYRYTRAGHARPGRRPQCKTTRDWRCKGADDGLFAVPICASASANTVPRQRQAAETRILRPSGAVFASVQ